MQVQKNPLSEVKAAWLRVTLDSGLPTTAKDIMVRED